MRFLAHAILPLLFASTSQALGVISTRATTCNGHPELCARLYSNVSYVGSHDSYAIGVDNLSTNQDQPITKQLDDGIRMLQVQVHNQTGVIQLCHTSCLLYNGGTFLNYLKTVKTWLDANPTEVLSILVVNSDSFTPSAFDAVYKAAGLDTISYAPTAATVPSSGWPTLGSMIDAGKRLVTFIDYGADFTVVPYLIDEFTNIWETAYDVTDTTFDCLVNRTKGDSTTEMYLINHFLDKIVLGQPAPDPAQANVTNGVSGVGSLGLQASQCAVMWGKYPTFMLVDFYEYGGGSVFEVAAQLNGLSYNPSGPVATPVPTTSGASATGTSGPSASAAEAGLGASAPLVLLTGLLLGAPSVVWALL